MQENRRLDKKMEIAQCIRRENQGNRIQLKECERILYGETPMLQTQSLCYEDMVNNKMDTTYENKKMSGLRLRSTFAIILFAMGILFDKQDKSIGDYNMEKVRIMIARDAFGICENTDISDMERLASLLDFTK